jgi:hypothetical protein
MVHPVVKRKMRLDRSTKGATFSTHPGAERYLREEEVLKQKEKSDKPATRREFGKEGCSGKQ